MSDERTGLLSMFGRPPSASLVWGGLGRGPLENRDQRVANAGRLGSWLRFETVITWRSRFYRDSWNSAVALLDLLEPDHVLGEKEAEAVLHRRIEAHCKRLAWPRMLLASPGAKIAGGIATLELNHALTAFVALSKSTGSIWLRDRPVRLAPLQSPFVDNEDKATWSIDLWFPHGLPPNLLDRIRK